MEQHNYISVAEFSDRVGLSRVAVNNYTNNDGKLVKFTKVVDGRKVISEAALELFTSNSGSKEVNSGVNNDLTALNRLVSWLEAELERVNCQLDLTMQKLDLTMQMLRSEQEKNTTLQEQILKLSNEFCEITKQSNVLLSQSQQISAKLLTPPPEPEPTVTEKKNILSRFKKRNRS